MRLALLFSLLGSGLVGCAASSETASSSANADTAGDGEATKTLDCTQHGNFPEAAMMGLGGTYVRAGTVPANGLASFKVGPLKDISGSGGKSADYTRVLQSPCTGGCTASGQLSTMMDNAAIGAFIMFDKEAMYFVTASKLDNGVTTAMCLGNAVTGETFLVNRQ
jgi:hypothetical protein